MKSILSKIAIRKSVGVYLGEHEIAVCKLASTPLGPVVIASGTEPCTPENMIEVMERMLTPLLGKKHMPSVAVGVASSRVFFSTRLVGTGTVLTPEALLQKALLSTNIAVDELTIDMLKGTVNKSPIAHVAACRTKYMTGMVGVLSRLGVRPTRAEPAPCALLRLAEKEYHGPRRARSVLRFFLGQQQGLAVLVSAGEPLAWKMFSMTPGMEGFAILSTSRVLATQQKHFGIDVDLNYVMIHGRPDLHDQLQQEQLPSEIGTRVEWFEGPGLDGQSYARGLAIGCLSPDIKAFDLARHLKARAPIKEIFPWGELSFAAGLIMAMGVILGMHSMEQKKTFLALKALNSQHVCLENPDAGKLEEQKKSLEDKLNAMRGFVESRILWTKFTRDVSERLPKQAELRKFVGKNPSVGIRKGGSAFELFGSAPRMEDGSIPSEVDAFLTQLPKDPLWQKSFSSVATEIMLPLAGQAPRDEVDFSVMCAPK